MLLFQAEENADHVERWCKQWHMPRGYTLSLDQGWELARRWYQDRMDPQWRRPTKEQAYALFDSIGLTGPFWRFE